MIKKYLYRRKISLKIMRTNFSPSKTEKLSNLFFQKYTNLSSYSVSGAMIIKKLLLTQRHSNKSIFNTNYISAIDWLINSKPCYFVYTHLVVKFFFINIWIICLSTETQ